MTTIVKDPGFKDGRVVEQRNQYSIEIIKDGTVTQTIDVYPHYYPLFLLLYLAVQTLLFGAAFAFSEFDTLLSWGGVLVTLQLVHFFTSLQYVQADELGAVMFYGLPVKRVSGLTVVPRGIFNLVKLPKKLNQIQFPSDPEKVWKATDEKYFALPKEEQEKYVLPIRALTAAPSQSSGSSILDSQMTIEVTFYVKWTVEQFWVFLIRIASIEELERQLRDSGERVLIQEIASRTPQKVQQQLKEINEALGRELERITQDSGITIDEAAMLSPDLTHGVNAALRDITVKKAEAAQAVIEAEGQSKATERKAAAEKIKLTLEGDGAAAAKLADAKALAKGAKALGLTPAQIAELEKARAFANGNATVIVDGGKGASSLTGIGTRIAIGSEIVNRKE